MTSLRQFSRPALPGRSAASLATAFAIRSETHHQRACLSALCNTPKCPCQRQKSHAHAPAWTPYSRTHAPFFSMNRKPYRVVDPTEVSAQGFRRSAVRALGLQDAQILRIHLRFAFFSGNLKAQEFASFERGAHRNAAATRIFRIFIAGFFQDESGEGSPLHT